MGTGVGRCRSCITAAKLARPGYRHSTINFAHLIWVVLAFLHMVYGEIDCFRGVVVFEYLGIKSIGDFFISQYYRRGCVRGITSVDLRLEVSLRSDPDADCSSVCGAFASPQGHIDCMSFAVEESNKYDFKNIYQQMQVTKIVQPKYVNNGLIYSACSIVFPSPGFPRQVPCSVWRVVPWSQAIESIILVLQ